MKWLLRVLIAGIAISALAGILTFQQEMKSLPADVGGWHLVSQSVLKPVPRELKQWRSGDFARKAWRGNYAGPVALTVTIYQTPKAWDTIQQWRVTQGKVAFMKRGYFGIAESPDASREQLAQFVQTLWGPVPETLR